MWRLLLRNPRLLPILLFVSLGGCGGTTDGRPVTVPVSGTLSYQGKPLANAIVSFHPQGSERAAFGETDSTGTYRLTTLDPGDGAMPGSYFVTVSKVIDDNAPPPGTEEVVDLTAPTRAPAYRSLLPETFARRETSRLTATVQSTGDNRFDFDLSHSGGK